MSKAQIKSLVQVWAKYVVFIITLAGVFGSLYYSEIQQLPPCNLCWYQRIALYPIAVIMLVASFRKDKQVYLYTAPLAAIGWIIALYNYLIQKTDWFVNGPIGCSKDNPCTLIQVELFGFITIPLMSLAAFSVILICNYLMYRFGIKYEGD